MRFFIDTEFIESGPHHPIDLLSIGIVAEDGRKLYLENDEADREKASDWVKENVIPKLTGPAVSLSTIRDMVLDFCDPDDFGKPEFWGYYADYDWVVFCQIFGRMVDLPKGFPMFCNDLKQLCIELGNPKLPKNETGNHNALQDAIWNAGIYGFLKAIKANRDWSASL